MTAGLGRVAAQIGADLEMLRRALRWAGHKGEVTADVAKAAWREWHDRAWTPRTPKRSAKAKR